MQTWTLGRMTFVIQGMIFFHPSSALFHYPSSGKCWFERVAETRAEPELSDGVIISLSMDNVTLGTYNTYLHKTQQSHNWLLPPCLCLNTSPPPEENTIANIHSFLNLGFEENILLILFRFWQVNWAKRIFESKEGFSIYIQLRCGEGKYIL